MRSEEEGRKDREAINAGDAGGIPSSPPAEASQPGSRDRLKARLLGSKVGGLLLLLLLLDFLPLSWRKKCDFSVQSSGICSPDSWKCSKVGGD
jgi:hypothetical protein